MSEDPHGDGDGEQEKTENSIEDLRDSSNVDEENSEEDSSSYEPMFTGIEDAADKEDSVKQVDDSNTVSSDHQPGSTALNELAEGESLTEVLTVALKEWREMQHINRQREEAEYQFRRSIIRFGAAAFIIVIVVSGGLSYVGKLPGSSFSFILGTLFGSLATLLQTYLRNNQQD